MEALLNPSLAHVPDKSALRTWGPARADPGADRAAAVAAARTSWIIQLNYIGIYTLPVLGLVLLGTGVGSLTSFGQAAPVGIGAYTTAYLTVNTGLSPWVTLFIGLALTGASAAIIGAITLRMSGHYLPLATIAWALLACSYLMGNLDATRQIRRHPGREGPHQCSASRSSVRAHVLCGGVDLRAACLRSR